MAAGEWIGVGGCRGHRCAAGRWLSRGWQLSAVGEPAGRPGRPVGGSCVVTLSVVLVHSPSVDPPRGCRAVDVFRRWGWTRWSRTYATSASVGRRTGHGSPTPWSPRWGSSTRPVRWRWWLTAMPDCSYRRSWTHRPAPSRPWCSSMRRCRSDQDQSRWHRVSSSPGCAAWPGPTGDFLDGQTGGPPPTSQRCCLTRRCAVRSWRTSRSFLWTTTSRPCPCPPRGLPCRGRTCSSRPATTTPPLGPGSRLALRADHRRTPTPRRRPRHRGQRHPQAHRAHPHPLTNSSPPAKDPTKPQGATSH